MLDNKQICKEPNRFKVFKVYSYIHHTLFPALQFRDFPVFFVLEYKFMIFLHIQTHCVYINYMGNYQKDIVKTDYWKFQTFPRGDYIERK